MRQAACIWHMDSEEGLEAEGDVHLGEALEPPDRDASRFRGGDGKVARFAGGRLIVDPKLDPKHWTLAIRLRVPSGIWSGTLLGDAGDDKTVGVALRVVDGKKKPMTDRAFRGTQVSTVASWLFQPGGPRSVPGSSAAVELLWGAREPDSARLNRIHDLQPRETWPNPLQQDVLNAVMKIYFPVGLIGSTDWHDIVAVMTGPKLELWIDGVLVDEEFPIGETRKRTLPFVIGDGFNGLIDHAAVWNRVLNPDEIASLCGGTEHVRLRELAILGKEGVSMQYFRPRGHNRKAGDLIPWWDEEKQTFRLFYLILRRNMHSKWDGGHGGLEIWQASTKDLKNWIHHPVTIPVTEQWEAWNGTGAVAYRDGQYNWFYPSPHYGGGHGGIQRAVSRDGIHFTKTHPHPFMNGGDCEIFQTGDGTFHMVKAGPARRSRTEPVRDKTLVAWVELDDLEQRGGSVLTLEHPDANQFDALVFGERTPRKWMPGSDRFQRTPIRQDAWPLETAPKKVVQVALSFKGDKGTLYRNGKVYAGYAIKAPVTFPSGSSIIMGRRHANSGPPERSFLRGRILDARLYSTALGAEQLAGLKPDAKGGPEPLAWFDFEDGSTRDRTGHFPDGLLYGGARVENGALVVGDGGYLKTPGVLNTQMHLTSKNLETWVEQEKPFISSERWLATCPNIFEFGGWWYYLCGSGFWRSKDATGPWTEHSPLRVDQLAVPKTGAFGKNRRIYAGFLPDGGWGGNSILRELVQDEQGNLGTVFVPELVPACGEPLPVAASVRLTAKGERQVFELPGIPNDFRLEAEIVPEPAATVFGLELRADDETDCRLVFEPGGKVVRFSKMGDSGGGIGKGPAIQEVKGLDRPFKIDVVVRHDILDAEIGAFRSVTTRFWNAGGDRIRLFVEGGSVTFRNLRIRPLKDKYEPYPGWLSPICTNSENKGLTRR